jgi:hypothetical protein
MQDDSRKGAVRQVEVGGHDTIEARMGTRIRETIEAVVEVDSRPLWARRSRPGWARFGTGIDTAHASGR